MHLVYESCDKLVVFKLLKMHSQSQVKHLLEDFIKSNTQRIMLITVNVQDIPKEVVNELRVMIEEEENVTETDLRKLFVL